MVFAFCAIGLMGCLVALIQIAIDSFEDADEAAQ